MEVQQEAGRGLSEKRNIEQDGGQEKRRYDLLKTILVLLIGITLVYSVVREIPVLEITLEDFVIVGITLVLVVSYVLLRYKKLLFASLLTLGVALIGLTMIALEGQGVHDPAIVALILVIVLSTLLLGKAGTIISTLLSISILWLLVYLENSGLFVHSPLAPALAGRDITLLFLLGMVLALFYDSIWRRSVNDLRLSREKYREISEELEKRHREIMKINEELSHARDKAEESDRLKTSFLANLSHEIRTPMNGIIGFSELLISPETSNNEKEEFSRVIGNSCKQLLGIVNDIIDISKIESGIIEINNSEFHLNEMLHDLHQFFEPEAKKKGLELLLKIPEVMDVINSDAVKLRQVLYNLLANALKFTEEGSVRFGYKVKQGSLEFYVEDTGIGIEPDKQEAIFDRFSQESTGSNRRYSGTGLGLPIAKAFVENMGGQLHVESFKSKGSRFVFHLPVMPVRGVDVPDEKNEKGKLFQDLQVLLVEDIPINELLLQKLLERYGFEVVFARSGEEALEKFESVGNLGMVFMDIKLPGMDGLETTRKIRKKNKEIPIIAQTAYAFTDDHDLAREAGCTDMITKPITQESVDEVINKYILS